MRNMIYLRLSTRLMLVFLVLMTLFPALALVKSETAVHDLEVSLTGPTVKTTYNHLSSGNSTILNATVVNMGDSYEPNVALQLLINNTAALSANTTGIDINQTFWTAYFWTPRDAVYNLTVYAYNDNANNSVTKWVWVCPDQPPTVNFTYSPPPPLPGPIAGAAVTFDASNSSDPDWSTILNYTWNFGDGNTTTVPYPVITHTYATWGNVTVTLTLLDNENLSSELSKNISVHAPPVARIAVDNPGPIYYVNEELTFDASASYDPDNNTGPTKGIANYTWDFGDGSNVTTTSTPTINHTYTEERVYTVTLNVTDYDEGLHASVYSAISIVLGRPKADFTPPTECYVLHPLTFDASASYDPDNNTGPTKGIANYTWDFGDGSNVTTTSTPTINHTYTEERVYTVTLNVTDYDEGLHDSINKTVPVSLGLIPGRRKDSIGEGYTQIIPVTVENIYASTTNFTISAYYDGHEPIDDNQTITLNPLESGDVIFNWTEIATWSKGIYNYTITLESYVNNTLVSNTTFLSPFNVTIQGDVTGDFIVKMDDIVRVLDAFGSFRGHPRWDPNADITSDDKVSMDDIVIALGNFGEHYP